MALDNYESPKSLTEVEVYLPVALAIGPERGWSAAEREMLRAALFEFAHMGERPLRVETAAVSGLAVLKSRLKLMRMQES